MPKRLRALLDAFKQSTRCAAVQPATTICGRMYWLEGFGTDCRDCGGSSTAGCNSCGDEPSSCAICRSNKDLVRDPLTNVVLCERDVLRSMAMQTLVVCKACGLVAEQLKMAVVQAVLGDVPVAHMLRKHADGEGVDDAERHSVCSDAVYHFDEPDAEA